MRKLLSSALAALLLVVMPAVAFAATPAGTAKGVDPSAAAVGGGGTRTLVVGADIFKGDVIKTGPAGQVEILFVDNTKLVVGPNSQLEIQDYLFRADNTAQKVAVDVLAGTFRFITGNSPHSAYQINVPTGTIAVRGTGFDGYVGADKIAYIMMYVGSTEICDKLKKECQILEAICQVGQIATGDTTVVGNTRDLSKEERDALRAFFMYAQSQEPLDAEFQLPNTYQCMHQQPKAAPMSGSTGSTTEPDECDWEGEGEGEGEGSA